MTNKDKKNNVNESLSKLEQITRWFDAQKEIDVEEGMDKVREGAALVKELEKRLSEIENEFQELKKDLGLSEEDES
jgi:hypothetical protein